MYLAFIHIGRYDIKARRHLARARCHVSIRQSPALCNAILNTCPCLLAILAKWILHESRLPVWFKYIRFMSLVYIWITARHCNPNNPTPWFPQTTQISKGPLLFQASGDNVNSVCLRVRHLTGVGNYELEKRSTLSWRCGSPNHYTTSTTPYWCKDSLQPP